MASSIRPLAHRTKIVATIGPASDSPETIRQLLLAGMSAALLNFSHGSYADHAQRIDKVLMIGGVPVHTAG